MDLTNICNPMLLEPDVEPVGRDLLPFRSSADVRRSSVLDGVEVRVHFFMNLAAVHVGIVVLKQKVRHIQSNRDLGRPLAIKLEKREI